MRHISTLVQQQGTGWQLGKKKILENLSLHLWSISFAAGRVLTVRGNQQGHKVASTWSYQVVGSNNSFLLSSNSHQLNRGRRPLHPSLLYDVLLGLVVTLSSESQPCLWRYSYPQQRVLFLFWLGSCPQQQVSFLSLLYGLPSAASHILVFCFWVTLSSESHPCLCAACQGCGRGAGCWSGSGQTWSSGPSRAPPRLQRRRCWAAGSCPGL